MNAEDSSWKRDACIVGLSESLQRVVTLPEHFSTDAICGYRALNSAGYVGSTASAYGLGRIADRAGWDTVMFLLLFVSVGASLLAWGTVLATYLHGRKHSPKPDERS